MMPEALHHRFELWSKLHLHRWRVDAARKRITRWLEKVQRPYVAFSSGKDSLCVLHLVRDQAPGTPAIYFDADCAFPESTALLAGIENTIIFPADEPLLETFRRFGGFDAGPELERETMRTTVWNPIKRLVAEYGFDGVAYGLRSEENPGSRGRLAQYRGPIFQYKRDGLWACQPIHDWCYNDVWCLQGDTFITTDNGEVPISELVHKKRWLKTKILTVGGFSSITNVSEGLRNELIRIHMENGRNILATPEHLVYTINRNWLRFDELTQNDILLGVANYAVDRQRGRLTSKALGYSLEGKVARFLSSTQLAPVELACNQYPWIETCKQVNEVWPHRGNIAIERGSCLHCWYSRWRGVARIGITKSEQEQQEIWDICLYWRNQYEHSTNRLFVQEIRCSPPEEKSIDWDQTKETNSNQKLQEDTRHSLSNLALYDHQETRSDDTQGFLQISLDSPFQSPVWGKGYAILSGIEGFECVYTRPIKIERIQRPTPVFDLETKVGNFFANRILVHNSFIVSNGIPYCGVYDKLWDAPQEDQRLSYWAGETKRRWGRWAWLRRNYPELFNRFAAEFPEVRCYV